MAPYRQVLTASDERNVSADLVKAIVGSDVDLDSSLMQAGLDSLGAVELRNAIAAAFSMPVPATITFDYPTVRLNAQYILAHSSPAVNAAVHARSAAVPVDQEDLLAAILTTAADILQAPITADQPFMEVGLHADNALAS